MTYKCCSDQGIVNPKAVSNLPSRPYAQYYGNDDNWYEQCSYDDSCCAVFDGVDVVGRWPSFKDSKRRMKHSKRI